MEEGGQRQQGGHSVAPPWQIPGQQPPLAPPWQPRPPQSVAPPWQRPQWQQPPAVSNIPPWQTAGQQPIAPPLQQPVAPPWQIPGQQPVAPQWQQTRPTQSIAPPWQRPQWQQPYGPPAMQPMEHFPQPGSPATGQPVTSRIDPTQIPRPSPSYTTAYYDTVSNNPSNLPPSATSDYVVRDLGNCSPRIMRSTLYQIPCSGDLLTTSGMSLALVVQPLALPHPSEEPLKVVDFGEAGPVRCSSARCKAYINPYMKFVDQGRRFICNLCGQSNETPRDYFCNLGPDAKRRDVDERPELSRGTVEFVATKEFMLRPPMPAVYFFLVDVSANAVKMGATASACSAIQRVLSDLSEGPQTLVGVATFDSTVHFYQLNKNLQQPPMLVVPDVEDVYTPVENGLVVPIKESREQIEQLLENIPSLFQDNRTQVSAFGAAIKGASLALKSTGGKLIAFQSVLPSIGFGALTAREAEGRASDKDVCKVLQPMDKTLKTLAISLSELQVCVDLFLTTQTYVDIASLSVIPRITGGQMYYYFPFSSTMDSAKLYNDLRWNVTRPQGFEAIMRVRCSQGLLVEDYHGSFCKRNPTDVDLAAIDCDKSIMVTFKHDDKFQEGSECCFQSALLYTTVDGERRIRVSTLSLPCTAVLSNLFRGADLDAQFTHHLKQAAQAVPTSPLPEVREQTISRCVQNLYAYRKFCATASSNAQLILPEGLKLLPLYTMALTKSVGLRQDARIDERSYWLTRVASLSASLAIPLVYPRMFAVHDLPSEQLEDNELPPALPLSSEELVSTGIFLLETGEDAFLYSGKEVSSQLLYQLFGIHSVDEVIPGQFLLQEYDNESSKMLNKVVNEIRRQRCSYLRLHLLKRGDPLEMVFLSFLVEDKPANGKSYVEFLVDVHKQIQQKVQASNS